MNKISKLTVKLLCVFLVPLILLVAISDDDDSYYRNYAIETDSRNAIVSVARQECDMVAGAKGGDKYRKWYSGRADGLPWCATFVSWCASESGLLEDGTIVKYQDCDQGVKYFKQQGVFYYTKKYGGGDYQPQMGDIIFFSRAKDKNDSTHTGIVESVDEERVYTIEGNSSNTVASRSYELSKDTIIGYASPKYPASPSDSYMDLDTSGLSEISIPSQYGDVYTYTNYTYFYPKWSKSSMCRKIANLWNENGRMAKNGLAVVDGYYLVACTSTFGKTGDIVIFENDRGQKFSCLIADQKDQTTAHGTPANKWGHQNGRAVVEGEIIGPNSTSVVRNGNNIVKDVFGGRVAKAYKKGRYYKLK